MIATMMPLGIAVCLVAGCGRSNDASSEKPATKVTVSRVRRAGVSVKVSVVGTVMPVDTSIVASEAPGLVTAFPFREGNFIRKGQPLASLRDVTLLIEIEKTRALLRQQQQKYEELRAGYLPEEVSQAEARMRAAEAAIHLAESHGARLKDLQQRSSGAITDQELDQAQYEMEKARQNFIEAKSDYEMKAGGYRQEVVAAAKAAVDAAQQEVRRLENEVQKHTVQAPFDAFLVVEHTDVGQWVNMGGPVATLARLDEVEVRVNIEESDVQLVQVGDSVGVRIDAFPADKFTGKVVSVVPRADWQHGSRSFPVVVRMKNVIDHDQPQLKEGMVARITFQGPPQESLLVHKDAIVRATGRPMVYVVDGNDTVHAVEITEGVNQGEFVAVEGDLNEDDRLATEGVERLHPFDRVAVLREVATQGISTPPPPSRMLSDEAIGADSASAPGG